MAVTTISYESDEFGSVNHIEHLVGCAPAIFQSWLQQINSLSRFPIFNRRGQRGGLRYLPQDSFYLTLCSPPSAFL